MSHSLEDSFLPFQRIDLALRKARNLLTTKTDVALAGTGVSSSQVGALLLLAMGMAHTSAELSRLLGLDPGFITRLVDRLESQRLVCRKRDSMNRRVVNLTLTDAGREVAAQIEEIVPEVLNEHLSRFTPSEFVALCELLRKLLDE
jgi:DNA-binding MarR family transcriptional regulator